MKCDVLKMLDYDWISTHTIISISAKGLIASRWIFDVASSLMINFYLTTYSDLWWIHIKNWFWCEKKIENHFVQLSFNEQQKQFNPKIKLTMNLKTLIMILTTLIWKPRMVKNVAFCFCLNSRFLKNTYQIKTQYVNCERTMMK